MHSSSSMRVAYCTRRSRLEQGKSDEECTLLGAMMGSLSQVEAACQGGGMGGGGGGGLGSKVSSNLHEGAQQAEALANMAAVW